MINALRIPCLIILSASLMGCAQACWMGYVAGAGAISERNARQEKFRQEVFDAQIEKKYALENQRRAKLGLPPLDIPKNTPYEKSAISY